MEPAFPCSDPQGENYSGMTIRDYFAAKALESPFLATMEFEGEEERWVEYAKKIAKHAGIVADAMMEERKK